MYENDENTIKTDKEMGSNVPAMNNSYLEKRGIKAISKWQILMLQG